MANNMTPSEIADWLDGPAGRPTFAATIRELEAKLDDKWERLIDALRRVEQSEAKLKIATEALEAIEVTYPEGSGARVEASCALARIKEGAR